MESMVEILTIVGVTALITTVGCIIVAFAMLAKSIFNAFKETKWEW